MKKFKNLYLEKYYHLILILFLLGNLNLKGQILPQALMHNSNAYPNKKLTYKEGSLTTTNFYLMNKNGYNVPFQMYPNPYIQSNFTFHFSNSSQFTIQFTFSEDWVSNIGKPMIFNFKNIDALDSSNFYFQRDLAVNKLYPVVNNVKLNNIINIKEKDFATIKYITLTYDGIKWVYYLNGVKSSDQINMLSFDFVGYLMFGIIGYANFPYSTNFDEVRFWSRALNQNEIAANWNKSLSGDEDGLEVYYNFNDQEYNDHLYDHSTDTLIDASSNKKNAVFHNFNPFCWYSNSLKYPILDNLVFNFDTNDLNTYPGTGSNNNSPSPGKLYNLKNFENNLQFYNSTSYNQIASPIYYADGGRSIGIQEMYGKTNMNTGIDGDMPITIEAWVKLSALDNISIVSIGENYDGNQFEMGVLNNKFILNVGGNNQLSSSSFLIANKWYHVICTYDNWQYNIYINGVNERKGYYVGPPPYLPFTENDVLVPLNIMNTPLYIGTSQRPFNGKIGILNVYNRALSSAETTKKFNATKSRFGY